MMCKGKSKEWEIYRKIDRHRGYCEKDNNF